MANTRYTFGELLVAQAIGLFSAGKTVTIEIINVASDALEVLTTAVCTPLSDDPATYIWEFSNLDTFPAVFTQYLYVMTDNSATPVKRRELLDTGGWAELISGAPIPANTCKITTSIFQADGTCVIDPNDFYNENFENYIEMKDAFFANSRYFKLDKYKPSYDQATGQAFWIMPQGAIVDIKVDVIGVNSPDITVPDVSTIDLYALLNP